MVLFFNFSFHLRLFDGVHFQYSQVFVSFIFSQCYDFFLDLVVLFPPSFVVFSFSLLALHISLCQIPSLCPYYLFSLSVLKFPILRVLVALFPCYLSILLFYYILFVPILYSKVVLFPSRPFVGMSLCILPLCRFLSLRVFGLLSSSLLLFPQRFGRYVLRPSSGVCRTREPTRNFELHYVSSWTV